MSGAGNLTILGNNLDNTITVSRDAACTLLVSGGAVRVQGGTPNDADPDALGGQMEDKRPVTPSAQERCALRSHRPNYPPSANGRRQQGHSPSCPWIRAENAVGCGMVMIALNASGARWA